MFLFPNRFDSMTSVQFFGAQVRLCFLLAVLSRCCASALADVPRTITAYVNETAILPCNITVVGELPTVEWSKEGISPNITILYRGGCETFEEKNSEFDDRTNLVLKKLKNGNLSQIIHNLRLSDAGRYQCRTLRGRQWKVESTVDLVVVASEPKLTFVPGTDGVMLQCKAECWSSQPAIQFLDDQGKEINALSPKGEETHPECFTFTRMAALPAATNRVKCRVSQLNTIRETEIFIPDDCMRSCNESIGIGASVTFGLMCLLWIWGICCYRKYRHYADRKKTCLSQLAESNEKLAVLERKNQELKKLLSEKEQRIQNLELKSKNTSAPKSGQSMRGSRSPLNGSKQGNQFPQRNTQNPATSSTSNHPEPDNKSEVKESKPAVPKQNPTPGPQEKKDRPKSMSAPVRNDGAAPEGTKHHRSSSFSASRSNIVRSPRRFTMPNRFSVLEDEDVESQSLIE